MYRGLALFGLALVALSACTPAIVPVGSHVTKSGPETSVDDVWILHGGVLKRCSNTPQGPVCVAVQNR